MTPTELTELSIVDAVRAVRRRKVSPTELVEAALDRVAARNPQLNAILTVTADTARKAANRLETRIGRRGSVGSLAGVPLTIKDLILTEEAPTTLGSKVIPDGLPGGTDAPPVARLRKAGAVVIGKANLHEVALGVTTVNEHFGPARNPWKLDRIAGGSSGGSAVAVAAGMGLGSVGSDTRGSIRIPAACCGITGFKPTYGTIATEGTFPLAASLDHLGPMTRSVEDAALLFGVMTGSTAQTERLLATVRRKPGRFRLAISEFFLRGVDPEIVAAIEAAVKELERLGASIVAAEIPELEPSLEASRVIGLAESIGYHDELLKRNRDGYGPLVRSRLEGGYELTALQLVRAEERRLELIAAYGKLFSEVDFLVGAVLPVVAPPQSALTIPMWGREVTLAEAFCHFNAPQNLTGCPALALPIAPSRSRLPMSVQLVAGYGADARLLQLGAAFQRATDWHLRRP